MIGVERFEVAARALVLGGNLLVHGGEECAGAAGEVAYAEGGYRIGV